MKLNYFFLFLALAISKSILCMENNISLPSQKCPWDSIDITFYNESLSYVYVAKLSKNEKVQEWHIGGPMVHINKQIERDPEFPQVIKTTLKKTENGFEKLIFEGSKYNEYQPSGNTPAVYILYKGGNQFTKCNATK